MSQVNIYNSTKNKEQSDGIVEMVCKNGTLSLKLLNKIERTREHTKREKRLKCIINMTEDILI